MWKSTSILAVKIAISLVVKSNKKIRINKNKNNNGKLPVWALELIIIS